MTNVGMRGIPVQTPWRNMASPSASSAAAPDLPAPVDVASVPPEAHVSTARRIFCGLSLALVAAGMAHPAMAATLPPVDATSISTTHTDSKTPVIVVIGDSIAAGTEDAITDQVRQDHAFGKQLADDLHIPFNNPDIGANGIPPGVFVEGKFDVQNYLKEVDELTKAATPVAIRMQFLGEPKDRALHPIYNAPGMGKRTAESLDRPDHPQHNFAVSGFELRHMTDVHGVRDYMHEIQGGSEAISGLVSETPLIHAQLQNGTDQVRGSAVEQAIAKHPDLTIAWGGNNDALGAIFGGVVDDRTVTPILDQPWNYWTTNPLNNDWFVTHTDGEVKGYLHAMSGADGMIDQLLKGTTGPIITMTVPNVTSVPYLRTVGAEVGPVPFHIVLRDGTDVTERVTHLEIPNKVVGRGKGDRKLFPAGSRVGLLKLLQALTTTSKGTGINNVAEFDARLQDIRNNGVFSEFDVLDPEEVGQVQARVSQFNAILARKAAENPRVHVIDMNAVFQQVETTGRKLRGAGPDVTVTATFTGVRDGRGYDGLFGFDGVHPSYVGHAVIANLILDTIKTDLKDDPVFKQYQDAPYIDEKAVLHTDPHYTGQWSVVLDPGVLDHLAAHYGTPLTPIGRPQVSDQPFPSAPFNFGFSTMSVTRPGAGLPGSDLFDLPDDAPTPPASRTPHENWKLRLTPRYTAGTRAQVGQHEGFGVIEAGVSQQFGFDYKSGAWEDHAHLTAGIGSQIGLQYGEGTHNGGNLTARVGVDNTLGFSLGNGIGLKLNGAAGVQVGAGTTFDHENPLSRFDIGGSVLVDKNLGASTVYAGPFAAHVADYSGRDSHNDLGARAGLGLQVDRANRFQVEGRVWDENRHEGSATDYGAYLQLDHQRADRKVTISPFVGYQKLKGEDQGVGGVQIRF